MINKIKGHSGIQGGPSTGKDAGSGKRRERYQGSMRMQSCVRQGRDLEFYFEWDGKPLEGFEHRHNLIQVDFQRAILATVLLEWRVNGKDGDRRPVRNPVQSPK